MKKLTLILLLTLSSLANAGNVYLYVMFHDDNTTGERFRTKMPDMQTCLKVLEQSKMPLPNAPAGDYEVMGAMWCGGNMERNYSAAWITDKNYKVD